MIIIIMPYNHIEHVVATAEAFSFIDSMESMFTKRNLLNKFRANYNIVAKEVWYRRYMFRPKCAQGGGLIDIFIVAVCVIEFFPIAISLW